VVQHASTLTPHPSRRTGFRRLTGVWLLGALLLAGSTGGCTYLGTLWPGATATGPVPEPLPHNEGPFLFPYTRDGTLTTWAKRAARADLGRMIGNRGAEVIAQELRQDGTPFAGTIGDRMGEKISRKLVLLAMGGNKRIRESSELSFDRLEELALYLHARYHGTEHYDQAVTALRALYPDFAPVVPPASP
jgi:hypothetical protein